MGLGAACFIAGMIMKRLAGLEGLVVLQFAFFIMVWLNGTLLPAYSQTYPLKYGTGYNLKSLNFLTNSANATRLLTMSR